MFSHNMSHVCPWTVGFSGAKICWNADVKPADVCFIQLFWKQLIDSSRDSLTDLVSYSVQRASRGRSLLCLTLILLSLCLWSLLKAWEWKENEEQGVDCQPHWKQIEASISINSMEMQWFCLRAILLLSWSLPSEYGLWLLLDVKIHFIALSYLLRKSYVKYQMWLNVFRELFVMGFKIMNQKTLVNKKQFIFSTLWKD